MIGNRFGLQSTGLQLIFLRLQSPQTKGLIQKQWSERINITLGSSPTLSWSVRRYFGTKRANRSEAMRAYCGCSSIFSLPIALVTVSAKFLFQVQLPAR